MLPRGGALTNKQLAGWRYESRRGGAFRYTAACKLMYWTEQNTVMDFLISETVWWIKHQRMLLWNVWIEELKCSRMARPKECVNHHKRSAVWTIQSCQSMNTKRGPETLQTCGDEGQHKKKTNPKNKSLIHTFYCKTHACRTKTHAGEKTMISLTWARRRGTGLCETLLLLHTITQNNNNPKKRQKKQGGGVRSIGVLIHCVIKCAVRGLRRFMQAQCLDLLAWPFHKRSTDEAVELLFL